MPTSSNKGDGKVAQPRFMWWESATGVADEAQKGLLPGAWAGWLTLAAAVVFGGVLQAGGGLPFWVAVPVGLVWARLAVLDLTTYTLPNIYTLPLLAVGWLYAWQNGLAAQAAGAAAVLAAVGLWGGRPAAAAGLGGGDLKLLAALFAFLPVWQGLWAVALGCAVWLPVAFAMPRRAVPLGVPVLVGWGVMVGWPHLPNWLFSTIS